MKGIDPQTGFGPLNTGLLLGALIVVLGIAGARAVMAGCYFLRPAADAGQEP